MKLKSIIFDNLDEPCPEKITVELSVDEALWIVEFVGKCRYGKQNSAIYDCLVGSVFNRYWEGGVDDAREIIKIDNIPDVVYLESKQ